MRNPKHVATSRHDRLLELHELNVDAVLPVRVPPGADGVEQLAVTVDAGGLPFPNVNDVQRLTQFRVGEQLVELRVVEARLAQVDRLHAHPRPGRVPDAILPRRQHLLELATTEPQPALVRSDPDGPVVTCNTLHDSPPFLREQRLLDRCFFNCRPPARTAPFRAVPVSTPRRDAPGRTPPRATGGGSARRP